MGFRIGISGSYGGMNLGDEAILMAILGELRRTLNPEVVVFSDNSADTEKRHKVRALSLSEAHKDDVLRELEKLDLFVVGGGGILFDGFAEKVLRDANWAMERGVPVMIYAVSAGPLNNPETRKLVVRTLNSVDIITVRESGAKKLLNDLGVDRSIEVTADPAFLLEPSEFTTDMLKGEGVDPERPLIGFSVREPGPAAPELDVDHYHAILANTADFMIERFGAQILFIPMEFAQNHDPRHSHGVISKMANVQRAGVLKGKYDSAQILGLIGHTAFVVGMRLHILIFAAVRHVPFAPLPYAAKVSGVLADMQLPMPPLSELNTGKLCAFLDRSWDTRGQIARKLQKTIPGVQEKARQTNRILCDFLSAKDSGRQ
ncbi:MAG: polysaccharide pyruvyl transferase family protein [Syntrophotaleaceae bacterium]